MTAGERLRALAGQSGAAGALLLLIGSGASAGAALVDYSGLASGTAAEHLLAEVSPVTPPAPRPSYGGGDGYRTRAIPIHLPRTDHDAEIMILFSDSW